MKPYSKFTAVVLSLMIALSPLSALAASTAQDTAAFSGSNTRLSNFPLQKSEFCSELFYGQKQYNGLNKDETMMTVRAAAALNGFNSGLIDTLSDLGFSDLGMFCEGKYYDLSDPSYTSVSLKIPKYSKGPGAVAKAISALRSGKAQFTRAAIAAKTESDGSTTVLIDFMGTSTAYDIATVLLLEREDGLHLGFLKDAQQFLKSSDQIRIKGSEDPLTLSEVFKAAQQSDCKYKIIMTGHSLGAGITQAAVKLLIDDYGILPSNIKGYGYASPCAAGSELASTAESYPVYNIISSDDVIPRFGSDLYIGKVYTFTPDDNFRAQYYPFVSSTAAYSSSLSEINLLNDLDEQVTMSNLKHLLKQSDLAELVSFTSKLRVAKNSEDIKTIDLRFPSLTYYKDLFFFMLGAHIKETYQAAVLSKFDDIRPGLYR